MGPLTTAMAAIALELLLRAVTPVAARARITGKLLPSIRDSPRLRRRLAIPYPGRWWPMPCDPSVFEGIPIFSLLDADERPLLAEQVDLRSLAARQRIYRACDPGDKAYVLLKGQVKVVLIDDDNQEVVIDAPGIGEIFGLASMLSASPHRTSALALEETSAIEVTRED